MIIVGYATTAVLSIATLMLLFSVVLYRKEIFHVFRDFNKVDLVALIAILAFFVLFSLLLMHPAEQLYFDENIYQGVALNILHNGNALWCQYGTGYLNNCYSNLVYHDPVEISFFLAIAFALFGIGIKTAYAMQLTVGTLSVMFVFLFSYLLLKKRAAAITAAVIFALMPELLIWSRTQADPDIYFMALTVLSFLFFMIFIERRNMKTLSMFMPSLILAVYARIEGMLLIPIFIVLLLLFGESSIRETFKKRLHEVIENINSNPKFMVMILVFVLLLVPQIYIVTMSAISQSYGQPQGQPAISVSNFNMNVKSNVEFLIGMFSYAPQHKIEFQTLNSIGYYPIVFPVLITYTAIIGAALLVLDSSYRNRFGMLLLLGIWFASYFLFYTAFYAGAVTFGVDVRFMLSILPPISVLAAIGITELSEVIGYSPLVLKTYIKKTSYMGVAKYRKYSLIVQAVLVIAIVIMPFIHLYNLTTLPPPDMPQQSVILNVITFFYNNYQKVPSNCLVFSLTPDIWYEFGRSSAQINYVYPGNDQRFINFASKYSCFVLDYGYWCVVPPNHSGICATVLNSYKHKTLAIGTNTSAGPAPAFYELLNYTP